jgi:hypothetical protein
MAERREFFLDQFYHGVSIVEGHAAAFGRHPQADARAEVKANIERYAKTKTPETKAVAADCQGQTGWDDQLKDLKVPEGAKVYCIYTAQEQCELSACIIGANPNALAKMKILSQEEVDFLGDNETKISQRAPAPSAVESGLADWAMGQSQRRFIHKINSVNQ